MRWIAQDAIVRAMRDQQLEEAGAVKQHGELDELVRVVGLRDGARSDHHGRYAGDADEQPGFGAEADLGMAVAAGQLLGQRDQRMIGWHFERGILKNLFEVDSAIWFGLAHRGLEIGCCPADDGISPRFLLLDPDAAALEFYR